LKKNKKEREGKETGGKRPPRTNQERQQTTYNHDPARASMDALAGQSGRNLVKLSVCLPLLFSFDHIKKRDRRPSAICAGAHLSLPLPPSPLLGLELQSTCSDPSHQWTFWDILRKISAYLVIRNICLSLNTPA